VNIGQRIREVRRELELSQEELAEKIGLNRSYLSLVENGKSSPTFEFIERVATGLGIDIRSLILGEKFERYEDDAGDESWVYPGLKELLSDDDTMILMNPTEEEINVLRGIRFAGRFWPSKEFFRQALIDYRKHRRSQRGVHSETGENQ
jgi:transcriptional regulator with XRE-family HTH domain